MRTGTSRGAGRSLRDREVRRITKLGVSAFEDGVVGGAGFEPDVEDVGGLRQF